MKKHVLSSICILCLSAVLNSPALAAKLETEHVQWHPLRTIIGKNWDTAVTTFDHNSMPPSGDPNVRSLPEKANGAVIAAYSVPSTDVNDGNNNKYDNNNVFYACYIRKLSNGPIIQVAAGQWAGGTMRINIDPITGDAVAAPGYWCDQVTDTYGQFFKPAVPIDSGVANNRIAYLWIPDLCGATDIWMVVMDTGSDANTQLNNVHFIITWY